MEHHGKTLGKSLGKSQNMMEIMENPMISPLFSQVSEVNFTDLDLDAGDLGGTLVPWHLRYW